ncbi:MAG: dethiobiotin synthase [Bacillota bacterium]
MGTGIFITGTDTGVGKTAVTAGLTAAFRKKGINAAGFKPVQSGAIKTADGLVSPDASFYLKVAGNDSHPSGYGMYCLTQPLSPHLAAEMDGVDINPSAIKIRCMELLEKHDMLLVEGAGGICAPLTRTGYTIADLALDLGLPLLVVARPALGTINHTVLTVKYSQMRGLRVLGFVFNGTRRETEAMEKDNAAMIQELTGVPFLGSLPFIEGLDTEKGLPGELPETAWACLRWKEIGGIDVL